MAATISTATRFSSINFIFDFIQERIIYINYQTDDGDDSRIGGIDLGDYPPIDGYVAADDLAVFREIYATSDKFQDAAGTTITIELLDFRHSTDVADLPKYGSYNPLVDDDALGGYNDWLKIKELLGLVANKMLTPEVVDNRQQLKHSLDIVPAKTGAQGTSYNYPLRRFLVLQEESDEFTLALNIPEGDEVSQSDDELDDYPDILAMLAWLESIRETGNAVGTGISDNTSRNSALGNREFEVTQATTDSLALRFRFKQNAGSFTVQSGNFLVASFEFERVSGAAIDSDKLRDYMLDTTASIDSSGLKLNAQLGDFDSWLRGQRIDFDGDHALEYVHDAMLYHGKVVGGKRYSVPIGAGWGSSVNYTDLPVINSKRFIEFDSMKNSYHYDGSTDATIYIGNPRVIVKYPGANKTIVIHNTGTGDCTIRDWDFQEIIILKPGEHCIFQIELDSNGYSGKMIDIHLPPRRMVHTYSSPTVAGGPQMSVAPYWTLSTNNNLYFREFPFTTLNARFLNGDAFGIYTTAPPLNDQGYLYDQPLTDFEHRGCFRMKKGGILTAWWEVLLGLDADVTGSFGVNNSMRLWRAPANGDDPVLPLGEYLDRFLSGSGAQTSYWIAGSFEVGVDDHLFAGLRYSPTNIIFESMRIKQITRRFTLQQSFNKEWTA